MHDAKGRELKVGDTVLMPFTVRETYTTQEYCNVKLESVATMPGNESTTTVSAVNTRQVLRANPGDDVSFDVVVDGPAVRLK